MKLIQIITHPLFLVISFLFTLINGQHVEGFFFFYILIALPHGSMHSILAVLGIGLLIFNYAKYKNKFNYQIEPILNISGALLLISSLFSFFYNDVDHYNYGTFYETVPLVILILFLLVELIFLIKNFIKISSRIVAT